MIGFIVGVVTGSIFFGDKKESDAEYRAKLAKADRQRAAVTLSKDLSDLPSVIEGAVTNVSQKDEKIWAYPFQVVTVGEWFVCLPHSAKVSIGSEVRIVSNSRVRVDGIWHYLPYRITKRRSVINRLLSLVAAIVCVMGLWWMWEGLQVAWAAITGDGLGRSPLQESMHWFVGGIVMITVATLRKSIPHGLAGLWKRNETTI